MGGAIVSHSSRTANATWQQQEATAMCASTNRGPRLCSTHRREFGVSGRKSGTTDFTHRRLGKRFAIRQLRASTTPSTTPCTAARSHAATSSHSRRPRRCPPWTQCSIVRRTKSPPSGLSRTLYSTARTSAAERSPCRWTRPRSRPTRECPSAR